MRLRADMRSAGSIFGIVASAVFYTVWTIIAFAAAAYFSKREAAATFLPVLSTGLLFVMLYWQLTPVISAGFGVSLDLRKLLVYPIPRNTLFGIEVLLRVTTCTEMLIVLAGAAIGLLRNPAFGFKAAPFIVAGTLAFTSMNLLLSAGIRQALERLFATTRMREAMVVVGVAAAILPRLFFLFRVRQSVLLQAAPVNILWPWAAAARLMLHMQWVPALLLVALYAGAAALFGRWQFERSIRFDGTAHAKVKPNVRGGFTDAMFRLPGRLFQDPVAALVEKELRTLARIPRFRMVYVMSCVFGLVLYIPFLRNSNRHSFVIDNAVPMMALYGLMMLGPISYWNSFGFDRSAVTGYFSWPIRFRDVLIAKNLSVAMLQLPQIIVVASIALAARMPVTPAELAETIVVVPVASLFWFTVGNIWSVRMPRPMDPAKMNQAANKVQSLGIFMAPLLLLPIGLAYWARSVFDSEVVFAGVLAVGVGLGLIFYRVGLDSAVNAAIAKRESMLQQLTSSDGPLSVT
jgi:ABC-2 type transport system permease protein